MADQTYKILLEVENREELSRLQKAFADAHQKLLQLNAQMKANPALAGQMTAQARVYATELDRLHTKIVALNAAVRGGILGGGGGGIGQGMLQLGYFADDLQYGLSAVVNNIPGIITSFGGPAGIAGAVALAAVAVNQLSKHWDDFFGTAEAGPKKVVEVIDIAAERLKKLGEEFKSMAAGQSFENTETGKLFKEYLSSGIGEQTRTGLAGALSASGTGAQMTEKEKAETSAAAIEKAVENAEKAASRSGTRFTDADAEKVRKSALAGQSEAKSKAEARIYEANREQAKGMLGAAPTEAAARKQVMDLARTYPDMFPKGFVEGMAGLEPEEVAKQDDEVQQKIIEGEEAKHNREMRQLKNRKDNELRKKTAAIDKKRTEDDIKTEVRDKQSMLRKDITEMEERKKKIHEESKNKSQTFKDTQSFLSNLQEKALDKIPKEQLEKLKHIDDNIKVMRQKIEVLGTLTS